VALDIASRGAAEAARDAAEADEKEGDDAAASAAREAADREERSAQLKQRMLVKERLRAALATAEAWTLCLRRAGFTRIGQLLKMPRMELVLPLRDAAGAALPAGADLTTRCARELGACVPAEMAALALESALEHWLQIRPDVADKV